MKNNKTLLERIKENLCLLKEILLIAVPAIALLSIFVYIAQHLGDLSALKSGLEILQAIKLAA